MALRGNGQLLIEVRDQPFNSVFADHATAAAPVLKRMRYEIAPLFHAAGLTAPISAHLPATQWALAADTGAQQSITPWNEAHEYAAAHDYDHFVEPDVLHEKAPNASSVGMKPNWPPYGPVSAGWHLDAPFTGFARVRDKTKGAKVRIAHLDTGFTPGHFSTPRNLRRELGWDFWDESRRGDATDPGTHNFGDIPGHGTATLALLAGGEVNLPFKGVDFKADIGGAPDSEIVPVRICPSPMHFYTSTMAKGLNYALAPGGSAANRCDVVSLSHGGLPTPAWAQAVNALYDAGIIVVAASGDSIFAHISVPNRYIVYPAAFNRVIAAVGATYEKKPYQSTQLLELQGNWGPDAEMEKALAAYTPNVVWMDHSSPTGFSMSGGGTSASAPQIAAACALWLSLYGDRLPRDWRRIEACRVALFKSTAQHGQNKAQLGWGLLDVRAFLDQHLADEVIKLATTGKLQAQPKDEVSFPFWRLLFGIGVPNSAQEKMYETELAQVTLSSDEPELILASQAAARGEAPAARGKWRELLLAEPISDMLRQKLVAMA